MACTSVVVPCSYSESNLFRKGILSSPQMPDPVGICLKHLSILNGTPRKPKIPNKIVTSLG